jgi:hypothetical protein
VALLNWQVGATTHHFEPLESCTFSLYDKQVSIALHASAVDDVQQQHLLTPVSCRSFRATSSLLKAAGLDCFLSYELLHQVLFV